MHTCLPHLGRGVPDPPRRASGAPLRVGRPLPGRGAAAATRREEAAPARGEEWLPTGRKRVAPPDRKGWLRPPEGVARPPGRGGSVILGEWLPPAGKTRPAAPVVPPCPSTPCGGDLRWTASGQDRARAEEAAMELRATAVPDCPNLPLLLYRLGRALPEAPPGSVVVDTVRNEAEAARLGMHGSPTLLVDGRDPFALPGDAPTGLASRTYRGADGHAGGRAQRGAAGRLEAGRRGPEPAPPSREDEGPGPPVSCVPVDHGKENWHVRAAQQGERTGGRNPRRRPPPTEVRSVYEAAPGPPPNRRRAPRPPRRRHAGCLDWALAYGERGPVTARARCPTCTR